MFFLVAIALASCKNPYPGYTETEEGIYYQLLAIGEQDKCCRYGDYVIADISYATMNDSVFFSGIRKFEISESDFRMKFTQVSTV